MSNEHTVGTDVGMGGIQRLGATRLRSPFIYKNGQLPTRGKPTMLHWRDCFNDRR